MQVNTSISLLPNRAVAVRPEMGLQVNQKANLTSKSDEPEVEVDINKLEEQIKEDSHSKTSKAEFYARLDKMIERLTDQGFTEEKLNKIVGVYENLFEQGQIILK